MKTFKDHMQESNVFTDARMNAIKAGKKSFKVGNKEYKITGDTSDELNAGVSENSVNDYFKRRRDEEDRIAGIKDRAKRKSQRTDYAKRRAKEKKVDQGVTEATGNVKLDNMLKDITNKKAVTKQQKADTQQRAHSAFGNMFGGGNPADKLSVKKVSEGRSVGTIPASVTAQLKKDAKRRERNVFHQIGTKLRDNVAKINAAAAAALKKEEVVTEGYGENDVANGGTVIYKHEGKHYMSKVSHKTGGGAGTKIHTTSSLKHVVPLHHVVSTDASDWPKYKSMKEEVELEEGKYASTIGAIAAAGYQPKIGDKIRTRKGGQIPGTVTSVTDTHVHFKHPEGKTYRTSVNNVMREEAVMEKADQKNSYQKAQEHMNKASEALETRDMHAHHQHLANHYEEMGKWHESRGRGDLAQTAYDRAFRASVKAAAYPVKK